MVIFRKQSNIDVTLYIKHVSVSPKHIDNFLTFFFFFQRAEFVDQLLEHSNSGRIASQDAVFQPDKTRSPDTLLTLPELIREQVPDDLRRELTQDPNKLLSLAEIVKELPPPRKEPAPSPSMDSLKLSRKRSFIGKRSRSLSEPPLAWLLTSFSRSSSSLRAICNGSESSGISKRELFVILNKLLF